MEDTQRGNMYRWHFDNSEIEAIFYGKHKSEVIVKLNNIFLDESIDFKLIGVEEMLSLEDKLA